jgi:DMSO/TMAO reductase YedYZ heme-binding membrane subunit
MSVASVLWGLGLATKAFGRRPSAGWLLDLHRFLGATTVVFTGVHVAALLLDDYIDFGAADVLVPFASEWRPGAVAWGVVAMYLLVAVEATSLLRRRMPVRIWRRLHLLSFPLAVSATVHLLQAGTDAASRIVVAVVVTAALVSVFVGCVRVLIPRRAARVR